MYSIMQRRKNESTDGGIAPVFFVVSTLQTCGNTLVNVCPYSYTIAKSKCYIQSATCNELHYYKPSVVVTYGLRIGITIV